MGPREERAYISLTGTSAGHVTDEVHDCVAMGDIGIEFVESASAKVFEVYLHLHFDIVPRKIAAQSIAIGTEFIGNNCLAGMYKAFLWGKS